MGNYVCSGQLHDAGCALAREELSCAKFFPLDSSLAHDFWVPWCGFVFANLVEARERFVPRPGWGQDDFFDYLRIMDTCLRCSAHPVVVELSSAFSLWRSDVIALDKAGMVDPEWYSKIPDFFADSSQLLAHAQEANLAFAASSVLPSAPRHI